MPKKHYRKSIPISQLDLDTENFRLEPSDSQKDTLLTMLEDQQKKLVNLAEDIITHGELNPSEQPMVIPNPKKADRYIVCEGNRRITALLLLHKPELISDHPLYSAFKSLSARFEKKPISNVDCVVFENKAATQKWADRKHQTLEGRGLIQWDALGNARRAETVEGYTRRSTIALDYLRKKGRLTSELEKSLKKRTTSIDRVLQREYFKSRLGVIVDPKYKNSGKPPISFTRHSEEEGVILLQCIMEKLAEKDFPIQKIIAREDMAAFIDDFAERFPSSSRSTASKNTLPSNTPPSRGTRQAADSTKRPTLAPPGRNRSLYIKEPRLSKLYREARELPVPSFTNCGALLSRVFLELSVDHYLKEKQVPLPQSHTDKGKTAWTDVGISLSEKIGQVLNHLDPKGKTHSLRTARQAISGDDYLHSVQSLHDMIHNKDVSPSDEEIKRIWDRWQPFFEKIYDALR